MRDFKAGGDIHVGGDLVVTDQSQEFKPLDQCANQELLEKEKNHKALLANEVDSRTTKWFVRIAIAALLIFGAAVWYWFHGKMDVFALLSGISGTILTVVTLRSSARGTTHASLTKRQWNA